MNTSEFFLGRLRNPAMLCLLLTAICGTSLAADTEFGRFYTTPKQRGDLDELRARKPQGEIVVKLEENPQETRPADSPSVPVDSITLNGVVYRSDGKNTAWVNRNSSNEGNIGGQFTRVKEEDIRANQAQITLPDDRSTVRLKVGQRYDVNSQQVHDVIEDQNSVLANPAARTDP